MAQSIEHPNEPHVKRRALRLTLIVEVDEDYVSRSSAARGASADTLLGELAIACEEAIGDAVRWRDGLIPAAKVSSALEHIS